MKIFLKPLLTFLFVMFYRLLPVRPPNVEPILASLMPISKKYGMLAGVVFSVLSISLYDSMTAGIGGYTGSTALAYAIVSVGSYFYFSYYKQTTTHFVLFSIWAVLFYDILTGVVLGPLVTGSSHTVAFFEQIPFTLLHLMGSIIFAIVLSPILSKWFEVEGVKVGVTTKAEALQ